MNEVTSRRTGLAAGADQAGRVSADLVGVSGSDEQTADARLELSMADLATRARRLIETGRRVILGITGPPGAGKSTLADRLHDQLVGAAVVVGLDGFHLAQSELNRLGRQARKGAPDTFDPFGYAALLRRLRENLDPVVYAPFFRRDLEEPIGGSIPVLRDIPLVITEGNYLLLDGEGWTQARQHIDQVWFLDLPDEVRVDRLIVRHQEFGKDPAAAVAWATEIDQANARRVQDARDSADLSFTLTDPHPQFHPGQLRT